MRIEELKFASLTEKYLIRNGYETLDDLTKIGYDALKNDGTLYNSVINKVHQNGRLMDFEVYFNAVIKKRLRNNEHIKIDELSISEHTKTSLKKINVDYVEELAFITDDMLKDFKIGELKEIQLIIKILGINKSKSNILNVRDTLKKYDVKLSEKTYAEFRAFSLNKLKDYLYLSEEQKNCLSADCRKELEELIKNTYNDVEVSKIDIEVEEMKEEIKQLEKSINLKEKQIKKLKELSNDKIILEQRLSEVNKQLKKTITECTK